MEKLSLYERLLKNKNRLKVQAVSLLLATTAVITTGCGKTEKPNVDNPQTDIVDVVDNDTIEEEMVPISIDNLDSEAERITNKLAEKRLHMSFEDVRTILLHLNKDSFSDEEYYSLFDSSEYEEEPINKFFKKVTIHNTDAVYDGKIEEIVNLKDFCRSEDGYKVIGKLENDALTIAKAVINDSENMDSEIANSLKPIYQLLAETEQIQIGDETFKLEDLDDETKTLIMYSFTNVYNCIDNVCRSNKLTDETKSLCDNAMKFIPMTCSMSFNNILDNIYQGEFFKTK